MSSFGIPPQAPAPTSRPATATTGAVIAIVLTSLSLLFTFIATITLTTNHWAMSALDFMGATGTVLTVLVLTLGVEILGVVAGVFTLRNSNPWRITLVVLAFLTAALAIVGAIGSFADSGSCAEYSNYSTYSSSCSDSNVGGGVFALLWGILAVASGTLLLINRANAWYSTAASRPGTFASPYGAPSYGATGYPPPPVPAPVTPAGWFPVDGGRMRWWDGAAWTDHYQDGTPS